MTDDVQLVREEKFKAFWHKSSFFFFSSVGGTSCCVPYDKMGLIRRRILNHETRMVMNKINLKAVNTQPVFDVPSVCTADLLKEI